MELPNKSWFDNLLQPYNLEIKRYVAFLSSPIHKPYLIKAYTYTTHTSTQTQASLCIHSYIHTYMCIYTYKRERESQGL